MPVKNFTFGEKCVESEVACMKIAISAFFDPTWTNNFVPKGPNMELLKQSFNFQSIRKIETILFTVM